MKDHETIIKHCAETSADRDELWSRFFSEIGLETFCEVGVYKGAFAKLLLSKCADIETYYMIDPWENLDDWNKPANRSSAEFSSIYETAMAATADHAAVRKVLRGKTKDQAKHIPDASLDAVYIDGDHTLRGITIDLKEMLPKVRPGGFICGDDFSKTIWQHGTDYDPTMVFPYAIYFAEAHDLPIVTLPYSQFLIMNTPEAGFRLIDRADYQSLTVRQIYVPPVSLAEKIKSAVPAPLKRAIKSAVARN